jgi:glycosyltransferase involved in cell wall biosynthesis
MPAPRLIQGGLVDGPTLSVLVPARNEAASLELLARRVRETLDAAELSWELILIDDGSTDGSADLIRAIASGEPRVRGRLLAGHQGKSAALACGIQASRGRYVVFMDADLQDLPEEMLVLLGPILDDELDLVQGWRIDRQDATLKVLASRVFNGLCTAFSGLRVHDVNCGFKAMRRSVAAHLVLAEGMHRFIPVQAWRHGFRVGEVRVRHARRAFGSSRYGAFRYLRGLNDLVGAVLLPRILRRTAPLLTPLGLLGLLLGTGCGIVLIVLLVQQKTGQLWELGLSALGLAGFGLLCLALSTLERLRASVDGQAQARNWVLEEAIGPEQNLTDVGSPPG